MQVSLDLITFLNQRVLPISCESSSSPAGFTWNFLFQRPQKAQGSFCSGISISGVNFMEGNSHLILYWILLFYKRKASHTKQNTIQLLKHMMSFNGIQRHLMLELNHVQLVEYRAPILLEYRIPCAPVILLQCFQMWQQFGNIGSRL